MRPPARGRKGVLNLVANRRDSSDRGGIARVSVAIDLAEKRKLSLPTDLVISHVEVWMHGLSRQIFRETIKHSSRLA